MGQLSGSNNRPGQQGDTGQIVLNICDSGSCDCEEEERKKTSTTTTTTTTPEPPSRRGAHGKPYKPSRGSSNYRGGINRLKSKKHLRRQPSTSSAAAAPAAPAATPARPSRTRATSLAGLIARRRRPSAEAAPAPKAESPLAKEEEELKEEKTNLDLDILSLLNSRGLPVRTAQRRRRIFRQRY